MNYYHSRVVANALIQAYLGGGRWIEATFHDGRRLIEVQPSMRDLMTEQAVSRRAKGLIIFWNCNHKTPRAECIMSLEMLPDPERDNYAFFNQSGQEIGRARADQGHYIVEAIRPGENAKVLDISKIEGDNHFTQVERRSQLVAALILLKGEFTP